MPKPMGLLELDAEAFGGEACAMERGRRAQTGQAVLPVGRAV